MRAVGFFTTSEKAEEYLRNARETGVVHTLDTMAQAREFLQGVADDATAVALNLQVEEGIRSAKYCFSIQTVLDKYLIDRPDEYGRD